MQALYDGDVQELADRMVWAVGLVQMSLRQVKLDPLVQQIAAALDDPPAREVLSVRDSYGVPEAMTFGERVQQVVGPTY